MSYSLMSHVSYKDQLIALLGDLYKQHKAVREYLDFFVKPNETALFGAHHERVLRAFYPKRGDDYNLRVAKRAISDFRKYGPAPHLLADLMLFYVECGVRYTNDYGDINENFYLSLEHMYADTLELLQREELLPRFAPRLAKVVTDTDGIGWGFHDALAETYDEYC